MAIITHSEIWKLAYSKGCRTYTMAKHLGILGKHIKEMFQKELLTQEQLSKLKIFLENIPPRTVKCSKCNTVDVAVNGDTNAGICSECKKKRYATKSIFLEKLPSWIHKIKNKALRNRVLQEFYVNEDVAKDMATQCASIEDIEVFRKEYFKSKLVNSREYHDPYPWHGM